MNQDDLLAFSLKEGLDDDKAEEAVALVEEIFEIIHVDLSVIVRKNSNNTIELNLESSDLGWIIGKKGRTLDALQFIVNKIINRYPEDRRFIVVDAGDYRSRHDRNLEYRARALAKRAISTKKIVNFRPMSARERRIIHTSLVEFSGVSTCSQGEGIHRHVQIIPSSSKTN